MEKKVYPSMHNMPLRIVAFFLFFICFGVTYTMLHHFTDWLNKFFDHPKDFLILISIFAAAVFSIFVYYQFRSNFIFNFEFNQEGFLIVFPFRYNKLKRKEQHSYEELSLIQYFGNGYDINSPKKIVLVFKKHIKHKMIIADDVSDRLLLESLKKAGVPLEIFIKE